MSQVPARQRAAPIRDLPCAVNDCTNDAGSKYCVGEDCLNRVCSTHYSNSTLCASCESSTSGSAHFQITEDETNDTNDRTAVPEEPKFQRAKLMIKWSDKAMNELCKKVALHDGHLKTGVSMEDKWKTIASEFFPNFTELKACGWQALSDNFFKTSDNLVAWGVMNERTNLSAAEFQPKGWHKLMMGLADAAEEAKQVRAATNAKQAKKQTSMKNIEQQVLRTSSQGSVGSTGDCVDDTEDAEGCINASSTYQPSSNKAAKTSSSTTPSTRSESPAFSVSSSFINPVAEELLAKVYYARSLILHYSNFLSLLIIRQS